MTQGPVSGEYFPYADTDYQEANRGQFHFSSRSGWMNDPNGLVYYRGTYHLYYQHNPYGPAWDTMHWGHATSPDLIHWRQESIALDPRIHPGDLWSGGGVVDTRDTSGLKDGSHDPIVVFSGTQGVRMFYSLDGGSTFTAYDDGRVVAQPSGTESRDPKVCWHEPTGRWVMVVWSDADGNGVDFFVSPDLRDWERVSRFAAGWLFECPDFTPMALDGEVTYVLRDARGSYVVGEFDGRELRTCWTEPCTITRNIGGSGSDYYAAQSFQNLPDDRVVTLAWQGGTANRRSVRYDLGSAQLDGYDLPVAPDGTLSLRLLVDRGQLDIFAADGAFYECLNVDFEGTGHGLQLVTDGPLMLK